MSHEKVFFEKLTRALKRSPSEVFEECVFSTLGGFGNEKVIKEMIQVHCGSYQDQEIDTNTTHFICPIYKIDLTRLRSRKDMNIKFVSIFWLLDSIYHQKLLSLGTDSEYFVNVEVLLNVSKKRMNHYVTDIPFKKPKLGEDIDYLFPSVETPEIGTLSDDKKMNYVFEKVPQYDPNTSVGKEIIFDFHNQKYFHAMLNLPDEKSKVKSYFSMQLIEAMGRNKYMVFCRWGKVGEMSFNWSKNFSKKDPAEVLYKKFYKALTNNDWEKKHNELVYYKQFFWPIKFEYKFTLPLKKEIKRTPVTKKVDEEYVFVQ